MILAKVAIGVLSTTLIYASYRHPRILGWVGIALLLLLGSVWELTVIADETIPLRIPQVLAMIVFGILLNTWSQVRSYRYLLSQEYFIVWFLLFLLLLFLTGLQNSNVAFLKFYLLHILPLYVSALVLGSFVVSDRDAFENLVRLMVFAALLTGVVSIVEEAYDISIVSVLSQATNLPSHAPEVQVGGVLRPVGIEGDPIATGQKLIFLLPFIVYGLSEMGWRRRLVGGWATLVITLIGVFLSRSRVDILGIGVGAAVFFAIGCKWRYKGGLLLLMFGSLIALSEKLWAYMEPFLEGRVWGQTVRPMLAGEDFQERGAAIRAALAAIVDAPLFGNGAFTYVHEEILRGADVPPVLLYFASGGILVGGLLLLFLYKMIAAPFKQLMGPSADVDKKLSIVVFLSILMGLLPLAVNNTDKLFPVIIFLSSAYISTFLRPVGREDGQRNPSSNHIASAA